MGRINAPGGAKGLEINGIIEQYKVAAGENISAGDFIRFLKAFDKSSDTKLGNQSLNISSYFITATALTASSVFIVYNENNNQYLYGILCTINNNDIIVNSETQLSNIQSNLAVSITLSQNKVCIGYTTTQTAHTYRTNL